MPQAYTRLRVISFRQPTVYHDTANKAQYRIPPGSIPAANKLARSSSVAADLTTIAAGSDLDIRMQRFWAAMVASYGMLSRSRRIKDHELKVFIAPEFYFRPDNNDKAYTWEQFQAFKRIMASTLEDDGRFENWYVVCGSLVWKQTGTVTGMRPPDPEPGSSVFYNTSVLIQIPGGGNVTAEELDKTHTSTIDGIPMLDTPDRLRQVLGLSYRQPRLTDMNGVKIGTDICLEHHRGYNVTRRWIIGDKYRDIDNSLDLQVIPSAGMWMQDISAATKVDGFMARVDGYGNMTVVDQTVPEANYVYTDVNGQQMRQVTAYTLKDAASTPSSVFEPAGLAHWDTALKYRMKIDIDTTHILYLPKPSDASNVFWNARPQKILIYPSQKL